MEKFDGNLKNLEILSTGYWGKMYILSDEYLLKTNATMTNEMAEEEFQRARAAYDAGVPCVEPVKLLETEEGPGVIYERVMGGSIGRRAMNHLESMDVYLEAFLKVTKTIWSIRMTAGSLPNIKDDFLRKNTLLSEVIGNELVEEYCDLIQRLPDGDRFLHMDLHLCNIMYNNGNCKLIDMPYASIGHPLFDMLPIAYFFGYSQREYLFGKPYEDIFRIHLDEGAFLWEGFCKDLFTGMPEELAAERREALELLSVVIFTKNCMRDYELGLTSKETVDNMRRTMTKLLREDKEFILRVINDWFKN